MKDKPSINGENGIMVLAKHKPYRLMLGKKILRSYSNMDELETAYDDVYNNPPKGMNENRLSKVSPAPVDLFCPKLEAETKAKIAKAEKEAMAYMLVEEQKWLKEDPAYYLEWMKKPFAERKPEEIRDGMIIFWAMESAYQNGV